MVHSIDDGSAGGGGSIFNHTRYFAANAPVETVPFST
jgi:hypothetical protein